MTLAEVRKEYRNGLSGYYPAEEVNEIFALLAEKWLGLKPHEIALYSDRALESSQQQRFKTALERLLRWEPVQYVIGHADFCGLKIRVGPSVLIPRPETEELVGWIVEQEGTNNPGPVLDIGSGSGCIALALKDQLINGVVHGMDISPEALELARENSRELGLDVHFFERDVFKDWDLPAKYRLIISNPPYVTFSEKVKMRANVLEHEPRLALYVADDDPLTYYREIGDKGRRYLVQGGLLFFELNERFAGQTLDLLQKLGYAELQLIKDFLGKDRFLKALWPG